MLSQSGMEKQRKAQHNKIGTSNNVLTCTLLLLFAPPRYNFVKENGDSESRTVNDDEDANKHFLELSQLLSSHYSNCIVPAAPILRGRGITQNEEQYHTTRLLPSLF